MSRRYRKSGREPGLIEIAATSNWKVAAGMSLMCVVGAALVIPALFGSSKVLGTLVPMLRAFAWLIACVFGAVSLFRCLQEQPTLSGPAGSIAARRMVQRRVEGVLLHSNDMHFVRNASIP